MSLTALTHVWKHSEQRHSTLLLLLAIADFADDYGRCWASVNTLARKARISERRVVDLVAILESSGEITIDKGAGPKGVNVYLIVGGAEIAPGTSGGGVQFRSAKLHPNLNEPSSSSTNEEERTKVNSGLGAISGFELLVRAWETTSGPITPGIAEDLGDLAEDAHRHVHKLPPGAAGAGLSGEAWVCAAIQEARVSSDGRRPNVKFIQRILERWMLDGFQSARGPGGGGRPATGPDAIDAWAERKKHGNG